MKRLQKITTKVIIIIISFLSFYSCISEDVGWTGNERVKIQFSYLDVAENVSTGIVAADVDRVHVYVFDKDKKFLEEWIDNSPKFDKNYRVELPLIYGVYNFVVWGGNTDNDYTIAPPSFIKGETSLNEALIKLNRQANGIVPGTQHHLFFANQNDAKVLTCDEIFVLPLMQFTNTINVTLLGLTISDPIRIIITDNNGSESFDKNTLPDDYIDYTNLFAQSNNDLFSSVRTMKLGEDRHPILKIINETTQEVLFQDDLIAMLLELKAQGAPVDFDNIHEYNLSISFYDQYTAISIDKWIIIRSNHILE